jgi:hypothetical protein
VYATVAVEIRDSEGFSLTNYLRSPARAYKDLRELRVAGVQAFATGPVDDHSGRNRYDRFIDEQVHFAHGGKVYTIISYSVDSSRKEFEEVLMSFEFLKWLRKRAFAQGLLFCLVYFPPRLAALCKEKGRDYWIDGANEDSQDREKRAYEKG